MNADAFRLDGKVALVTGAGQGIGRAISIGLAKAGADIALTDLETNQEASLAVQLEITRLGFNSRVYALDVRSVSNIGHVVNKVTNEMGKLDILVNNAGVRIKKPALEITEEEWNYVLDVNLKGMFFCAQAAAHHMAQQGSGKIINITSQLGLVAMPNRASYCASKAGGINLTRALAMEWISMGINVNAIGPGPTNTPMARDSQTAADQSALLARMPLGRRLEPEEIVGAAIYLSSAASAGVNGHTVIVDGGWNVG